MPLKDHVFNGALPLIWLSDIDTSTRLEAVRVFTTTKHDACPLEFIVSVSADLFAVSVIG